MGNPTPIGANARILETFQAEALENVQEAAAQADQVESKERLGDSEDVINIGARFEKTLKAGKSDKLEKAQKAQESVLIRKDEADGLAGEFSGRDGNRQYRLNSDQLSLLLQGLVEEITPESSVSAVISRVQNGLAVGGRLPDVGQVDKAFDFLLEVLKIQIGKEKSPEFKAQFQAIYDKVSAAKAQHMVDNQAAIEEAHKIIGIADIIVESGKTDTPEALAHLRDVIHNPQDLSAKFTYYRSKGYTYKEIKGEIDSILHLLGKEFKRVDIPTAEMDALMKETRKSQAILQIFRHFKKASALGERLFDLQGLAVPRGLK